MIKKILIISLTLILLISSVCSFTFSQALGWAVSAKQGSWEVKALCAASAGATCETAQFAVNPQGYIQSKSLCFLSEASPEIGHAISAAINPEGFITQQALTQIAKENPETAKGLSETLTTIDQLKALGVNDGEVKFDSKGLVTEAKFKVEAKEGEVGNVISKDLKKEEVLVKNVEIDKKEGTSTLTFTDENGYVKIKDKLFMNIKKGGVLKLDEKGEVVEADIMSDKQGGVFTFGINTVKVESETRVTYKNGQIQVYGAGKSFDLSQASEGRKTEIGKVKVLGESVIIDRNKIIGKHFEGEGFKVIGLDNGLGEVTFLGNKIINVGKGTDAIIQGVEHKTFEKDLNLYYKEDFDPKEHKGENYFNYGKNKIWLGGSGFKSVFDGNSPVVNVKPGDKDRFLEISPQPTSAILIENRNIYNNDGTLSSATSAPKITIQGDDTQEVWAELKDNGNSLSVGKEGVIKYRLLRGPENQLPVQTELNIISEEGKNLLLDPDGREIKVSINDYGTLRFATVNAQTDINGDMSCHDAPDCVDDYFTFEKEYSSKVAIDSAKEEYEKNINKKHDFMPEYSNNLESITLFYKGKPEYMTGNLEQLPEEGISETQIEIMKQLPVYTKIKLFVENDEEIETLRRELPKDVFDRITFLKPGYWDRYTVWAQDYTEGDSKVQILPLTYLGGGSRKTPDLPESEFIYQLENVGIDVRKIPVEFGGGNVFITKDASGKKILLTGANDYLDTKETYSKIKESISEEEFKLILKNAFNVDEVTIVGTRDESGSLDSQPEEIFHIDQVMLPLGDGIVAMPSSEDVRQPKVKEYVEKVRDLIEKKGFKIVDLRTNSDAIESYQAYTNSIVYTDKITGEKMVMMPIFPDENGEYKMEGLNKLNKETFERAGFKVKVIKDKAFRLQGNIHCITLLAQNAQHPPSCSLS